MTQASLSPDLPGAPGAPTSMSETQARTDISSEASLWMIALTSSGLVGAAALLLSLLAAGVVRDASFGGFVSGIAVMIAMLGAGAMVYTLVIARRQGFIGTDTRAATNRSEAVPAGMHVVPALPPDLGLRKRRAQDAERAARNRQAEAIAMAAAQAEARPAVKQQSAPGPVPTTPPRPTTPARPAPPVPVASAAVARVTQVRGPVPDRPAMRSVEPPIIRMPRPHAQVRPAPWPTAAPARMPALHPMPRTQATLFQVRAAHVRPPVPYRHR